MVNIKWQIYLFQKKSGRYNFSFAAATNKLLQNMAIAWIYYNFESSVVMVFDLASVKNWSRRKLNLSQNSQWRSVKPK